MRRYDPRLIIGVLLVLGGLLALLDEMGIVSNASGIFWGLVLAAGGLVFLYMLVNNRDNWWAALPAFTLLGSAVAAFLPEALEDLDWLVFFAGISLGFWWVYFTSIAERWWAIIPAGVLLTLGIVSALADVPGMETGGLFSLGLGVTFILVAILPGGGGRSWALIPGTILMLFGALLGTPYRGITDYLWPAVLIVLGGYLVLRFLTNRPPE
ncbi:MAG: hypothetical protein JW730_08285 [Anaerolineales bacterium]|nr:hypothetical protein [Anaerolineales bacterium]